MEKFFAIIGALRGCHKGAVAMLLAGVAATLLVSAAVSLGELRGVLGLNIVAEVFCFLSLVYFFPEKGRLPRGDILWALLCGMLLGLVWIAVIAIPQLPQTEFPSVQLLGWIPMMVGLARSVLIAPFFEEKVVRYLLLRGAEKFIGPMAASIGISFVFGIAHAGSFLWAFAVSLLFCVFAYKLEWSTTIRAIAHAVCNAIIYSWYFTGAYGFS